MASAGPRLRSRRYGCPIWQRRPFAARGLIGVTGIRPVCLLNLSRSKNKQGHGHLQIARVRSITYFRSPSRPMICWYRVRSSRVRYFSRLFRRPTIFSSPRREE